MLKILQVRLQQYMNWELPEIKLPTSVGSSKKQAFGKNVYFCFIEYPKAFDCVYHTKLGKILQEMGIPDHLTCLLRNLYAVQVATRHEATDGFQIGKDVHKGCILSLCLCNLYAEYIMRMLGWRKHNLESRLPGEISITSDMQWHHPFGRKLRGAKEPLEESERG